MLLGLFFIPSNFPSSSSWVQEYCLWSELWWFDSTTLCHQFIVLKVCVICVHDLQSWCQWSHFWATLLAVFWIDLIGQGVPTNRNIFIRTPFPRGSLKCISDGHVFMTLERTWGPSRNGALGCNSAQEEDSFSLFNLEISRSLSKSSLLYSAKPFGFSHYCF